MRDSLYSFHFYSCPSPSLDAFSATPPASEVRAVVCPLLHGFPLALARVSPRLSIVCLRRRRGLLCVAVGAEVGEQERVYTVSTFILVRVSPSTLSVRRLQRRSPLGPLLHGFPLALARVSPAVKHSAPPPEA